jgi:hypothetical protein
MEMIMTTLSIDAKKYEDHDDCLAAAASDVAAERGLQGRDLSPRWQDDERETILIDIPDVWGVEYLGLYDATGDQLALVDGYSADDWLPDYDSQAFPSEAAARRWIEENHRGPDVDGIVARFAPLSHDRIEATV